MSRARSVWVLTVLCAGVGLVMAAITTLYTSAPDLARGVGASQSQLTWMIDAYTLAMAGLLLPAGAIGDRYGRKEVLVVGLAFFTVIAIALCFVDSPNAIIGLRLALGMAAAFVLPSTLSLVTTTFPEDFRDMAVAIWTAAFTLAAGVSMLVTAILLEFFSWHSAFWGVAVGAVIVLAASLTVPTSRDPNPPRIDVAGALAAACSISLLVYALIQAGLDGWGSPNILAALVLAIAGIGLFAAIQLRSPEPLLDVRLFRIRAFGVSAFTVMAAFAAVYGSFFLAVQFGQFVLGYSALKAAIPVAAMVVPVVPISLAAPRLTERLGLRFVVSVGCALTASAYAVLLFADVGSSYALLLGVFLLMGSGTGLNMTPCTNAIISSVPEEKQGVGASVNHTTREVGTALGVALLGGLLSASYPDHVAQATQALPDQAREASRASVAGALEVAGQTGGASGAALADAAREAFVAATHYTSLVMLIVMAAVAVIAAFWAPPRSERRAPSADVARPPVPEPALNGHVPIASLRREAVGHAVGLARIGAVLSWRTASWTVGTTARVGGRVTSRILGAHGGPSSPTRRVE